MNAKITRKKFFDALPGKFANFIFETFSEELENFEQCFPELIRPPGAGKEENFLKLCIKCGNCIKACPHYALIFSAKSNCFDEDTPCLNQGKSFCRFCIDFPCIAACPTGALTKTNNIRKIGVAKLHSHLCIRTKNIECSACAEICPEKAISLTGKNKAPAIKKNICTGCGACLQACPASPEKAISIMKDV
jgi:ferredoxin-type protein NapG